MLEKYKNIDKYNYYFVHDTLNLDNILSILKDGYLYPGKDVSEDKRKYSGGEPSSVHSSHSVAPP